MVEVGVGLLEKAAEIAKRVGRVFIATSSRDGWPHLALARTLVSEDDYIVDVREWFQSGNTGESP